MAIVCLTALGAMPADQDGNIAPVLPEPLGLAAPQNTTSFATSTGWAVPAGTRFFRLANDTAIHVDRSGGAAATTADEYFPVGERVLELPKGVATVYFIAAS